MANKKIYKNRLSLPIFDNKGMGNGNGIVYVPNIIRGGSAIPIGNNMFFMKGKSHSQGGIDIGKDLEVERNEVVQNGKFGTRVFSSVPFLRGVSPAQRVLQGENPDDVFAAQENWKRINKINDDGSRKARKGKYIINPNIVQSDNTRVAPILNNTPKSKEIRQGDFVYTPARLELTENGFETVPASRRTSMVPLRTIHPEFDAFMLPRVAINYAASPILQLERELSKGLRNVRVPNKSLDAKVINYEPKVSATKSTFNDFTNFINKPVVKNVIKDVPAYQIQRYPGYMLKSLMEGNPLEKQLSKVGTISVNSIKAQAAKSSNIEKSVIDKILSSEQFAGQKAVDYNNFRKAVQDELIAYNRKPQSKYSTYGMNRLGFNVVKEPDGAGGIVEYIPDISTRTFTFESPRIGIGSNKHYDYNTLGHSRTYVTKDEPNVLHVMESQSDWAQKGVANSRAKIINTAKEKYGAEFEDRVNRAINRSQTKVDKLKSLINSGVNDSGEKLTDWQKEQLKNNLINAKEELERVKSTYANVDPQELYLSNNYTSRQIQENLRYAAENGQTKMRYPTRDTAAKIENYTKQQIPTEELRSKQREIGKIESLFDGPSEIDFYDGSGFDKVAFDKAVKEYTKFMNSSESKVLEKRLEELRTDVEKMINNLPYEYPKSHETILRKYDSFPKEYKKLYKNSDINIITDSKGNTWYEVDVPKDYLNTERAYKFGGRIKSALGLSLFRPNSFRVQELPIDNFLANSINKEIETPEVPAYVLKDDEKPVGKKVNPNIIGGGKLYNGYAVDNHEKENINGIGGGRVYTAKPIDEFATDSVSFGDIKSPRGFKEQDADYIYDYLSKHSDLTDTAKAAILATAAFESGMNPRAKNKYSTAKGYFQWLDDRYIPTPGLTDEQERIAQLNKIIDDMTPVKGKAKGWTQTKTRNIFDLANEFRTTDDIDRAVEIITRHHIRPSLGEEPRKNKQGVEVDKGYKWEIAERRKVAKQFYNRMFNRKNKKEFGGRIKAGLGDWLKNAIIGASVAENPAVATASGWKQENGNWVQKPDENSRQLANNLAELSLTSPTNPITAAIDKTIGLGIKGYRFLKPFLKKNINSSKNIIKEISSNNSEIKNIFADDKAKKALLKNYYTRKINGETLDYSIANYVPNTSKGLTQKVKEDLMHNTVERELRERGIELAKVKNKNGELFFPNGEKDYKYLLDQERKEANKLFDDVNVGRYSDNDYKQAEVDFEGFFDKDKNFISINKDSKMPYVENHEGRHLYDTMAKPVREDVLSAAYDKGFENIPNTKYAGDLKDYKYMKDERVTTNRDARDKAFTYGNKFYKKDGKIQFYKLSDEPLEVQDNFIDKLNDAQIFESVENSNGYGRRFIEYLRDNNLLTKEKAEQFREAMKHVGATIPFAFGANNITNEKQFGGMKLNIFKLGGLSRSKDYGSKDKPYPSVDKNDFAGGGRSYPIPTRADAVDALRLAGLHHRSDVRAKVYAKYPDLRKKAAMGTIDEEDLQDLLYQQRMNSKQTNNANETVKNNYVEKINNDLATNIGKGIVGSLIGGSTIFGLNKVAKNYTPSLSKNNRFVSPTGIIPEDYQLKFGGRKKAPYGTYITIGGRRVPLVFDTNNKLSDQVLSLMYPTIAAGTQNLPKDFNRLSLLNTNNIGTGGSLVHAVPNRQNSNGSYFPINFDRLSRADVQNLGLTPNFPSMGFDLRGMNDFTLNALFGNLKPKDIRNPQTLSDVARSQEVPLNVPSRTLVYDVPDYTGNINGQEVVINPSYMRQVPRSVRQAVLNNTPEIVRDASSARRGADSTISVARARELFSGDSSRNIPEFYQRERVPIFKPNPLVSRFYNYGWSHNSFGLSDESKAAIENAKRVNEELDNFKNIDLSKYFNTDGTPKPNPTRRTRPVSVRTERVGNIPAVYTENMKRPNLTQLGTQGIGLNMPAYTNPFTPATTSGTRTYDIGVPTTLDTSRLDSTLNKYGVTPISSSTGVQPNSADVEAVRSGNFKAIDNDRYVPIHTTTEDWVGLGANLLGSIGSYLGTRAMLNRYPMPSKPVPAIAQKLKTRFNINSALDQIREQAGTLGRMVDNNTASSRVAQARKQGISNNATASANQQYNQKENIETQLINQDIMNRQRVGLYNNQVYNNWLSNRDAVRRYVAEGKIGNFNNVLSNTNQAFQDLFGRIEGRNAVGRNLIFMQAAYPNVNWRNIFQNNRELARSFGFRFV